MRKTIEDKKSELIEALACARRLVLEEIRALPCEQWDEVFLGAWSVKDLTAHLIGWDYTNRWAVQAILSGEYPEFFQHYDKDWTTYNRELVHQYKREPFDELLSDAQKSHAQLIDFLKALPAESLVNGKALSPKGRTVSVSRLVRAEAEDERKHAEQVKDYRTTGMNTS